MPSLINLSVLSSCEVLSLSAQVVVVGLLVEIDTLVAAHVARLSGRAINE